VVHKISNQGGGAVDLEAFTLLPAAVTWNRDLDRAAMRRKHSPERGSASMADRRLIAQGEHGCHAPSFEAES
jgi:hypothetical protein